MPTCILYVIITCTNVMMSIPGIGFGGYGLYIALKWDQG